MCVVERIKNDFNRIGLPTDLDIQLRGYSKTYEGRYNPSNKQIVLYHLANEKGFPVPYNYLLSTAIHECVHHVQWTDPNFIRVKGVMHDPEFWKLYNLYIERAYNNGLFLPYRNKLNLRGYS